MKFFTLMFYEEQRIKRLRGFALGVFGSFIFSFSSAITVILTNSFIYLAIASMSLAIVVLAYLAVKSSSFFAQVVYILSAGSVLAAEASSLFLYFYSFPSFLYSVLTLVGSFLALKGIRDIESLREERDQRRKEEIVRFQGELA